MKSGVYLEEPCCTSQHLWGTDPATGPTWNPEATLTQPKLL